MAHEWKIGDWAEYQGVRYLCYRSDTFVHFVTMDGCAWCPMQCEVKYLPDCTGWDWKPPKPIEPPEGYRLVTEGEVIAGDMYRANNGCWFECLRYGNSIPFNLSGGGGITAYARKIEPPPKIEPPEGYRLLERNEVVLDGDVCLDIPGMGAVKGWRKASGKSIGCTADFRMENYGIAAFARKIERYRPFANAAELSPHRDKWVRWHQQENDANRVISYSDTVVWVGAATECLLYKEAFECLEFEDGTPFGVKE